MNVLAVRPSEIACVWTGPAPMGGWQVIVTLKSGAKTVITHDTAEDAALDWDRIVASMGEGVARAGSV